MTIAVTVRHNFETAHRLYDLGPGTKCWNLHGHSWWAEITVESPDLDSRGMVVEFGEYKRAIREWIDEHLDHGAILNINDPLARELQDQDCKVWVTAGDPTVETVAQLIEGVAVRVLEVARHAIAARVVRVAVQETHVNGAVSCLS